MTNTLYQNIQALGNRMVTNLGKMGVSAEFADGGLTLADKILEIQHFNDGVTIYSDKSIEQSGNTINFYSLVLEDGIPVSGATVKFKASIFLRSKSATTEDRSIGDDYYVTSAKTGTDYDTIGAGTGGFIAFNSSKVILNSASISNGTTYKGKLHIKDGVLSFVNADDETVTVNVSEVNTTKLYTGAFTVYYDWVEVTTGSNGVATYEYTCTGAGELNVKAISGSVVSQPVEVLDCLFMDYKSDGTKNTNYYKSTNATVTYSDGEITVYGTATGMYISNQAISGDFEATLECKNVNGNGVRVGFADVNSGSWNKSTKILFAYSDYYYLKFRRVNGAWTIQRSTDGETWTTYISYDSSNLTTEDCYFMIYVQIPSGSDERRITYKNLKIYPI